MKRFATSFLIAIIICILTLPLWSSQLWLGICESWHSSGDLRVDVSLRVNQNNTLKITSGNTSSLGGWDKTNNTFVISDEIGSEWQKYEIRALALNRGILQIFLRGPVKKIDNEHYQKLVEYRNLKINGESVFEEPQVLWHDNRFLHKLLVNDNEEVTISFESRMHPFQLRDLSQYYHVNFWILFTIFVLAFAFFYKLISYVTKFKVAEKCSPTDIIFVCAFFVLLYIPMSDIDTAEQSAQENRMLAKKPELFTQTGVNSQFGADAEKWFNDRFLGRIWAIRWDSMMRSGVNHVYKNGDTLYISSNNWMFNNYYYPLLNQKETTEAIQQLNILNQLCKQNNIKFYILFVPYKSAIYHEILEEGYTFKVEDIQHYAQYVDQLKQKTGIPIIHPYEELRKARHDDFVFFKQSHHWTDWGAYQGYLALMREIVRDFPDIKIVSLSDYKKSTSKLIRDDWARNYNTGHTTRLLGFDAAYAEKYLLKDDYTYYEHKSGNTLQVEKKDNMKRFAQNTGGGYRIFLIGNSQNENLLQFLPYSARELKYIRLNAGKLPTIEQPKLLKYYKKDILDFKPDILIYSVSSEISKQFMLNLTTN